MNQAILDWIETRQRGKLGIYPYQVAVEVCIEFGVSMKEATDHVAEHVKRSIHEAWYQGHINTKFD